MTENSHKIKLPLLLRRDPETEGFVKPGLPASAPFPADHLGSRLPHRPLLLAQDKVPRAARFDRVPRAQSIRSRMGAVEEEVVEIGAKDGEAALPSVALQGGLHDGGNQIPFVHQKAEGAGAAENIDGDKESVAGTTPIAAASPAAKQLVFLELGLQGWNDDGHRGLRRRLKNQWI